MFSLTVFLVGSLPLCFAAPAATKGNQEPWMLIINDEVDRMLEMARDLAMRFGSHLSVEDFEMPVVDHVVRNISLGDASTVRRVGDWIMKGETSLDKFSVSGSFKLDNLQLLGVDFHPSGPQTPIMISVPENSFNVRFNATRNPDETCDFSDFLGSVLEVGAFSKAQFKATASPFHYSYLSAYKELYVEAMHEFLSKGESSTTIQLLLSTPMEAYFCQ